MFSSRNPWLAVAGAAVALLAFSIPAAAAPTTGTTGSDIEKLLPDDTESVLIFNFKQLLDSPLLKKGGGLDGLKDALQKNENANKAMAELGLNPFTDVTAIIGAQTAASPDQGRAIILGTFDVAKFKAKAEAIAKAKKDNVKIDKATVDGTEYTVYEVSKLADLIEVPADFPVPVFDRSDSRSRFVGVDKSALILSTSKEDVADALAKAAGKKKTVLKSKEMKSLLAKVDPKQTLSFAFLAEAVTKGSFAEEPEAKEIVSKLDHITGGITVAEGIKTQIVLAAKTGDDAKELSKKVDDGLDQAQQIVGTLVEFRKDLAPLLGIVKGVKAAASGKTVTIDSDISGETVQDLAKTLGQMLQRGK